MLLCLKVTWSFLLGSPPCSLTVSASNSFPGVSRQKPEAKFSFKKHGGEPVSFASMKLGKMKHMGTKLLKLLFLVMIPVLNKEVLD